jgi:hypothetical protein
VVGNVSPDFFQAPQQPLEPMDEDVIVASSDSEEGAENVPIQFEKEHQEVNVFIPMDNGVPLQLIPDEIQEHELIGGPDLNLAADVQIENNLEQLGFVELLQPAQDLVFMQRQLSDAHSALSTFKCNPKAIRLWANFLAPVAGASSVQISMG